ncbi:MAG: hypothetical protein MUE94_06620 [Verrucomicrobia bacterium]|jgi:hypothetical protein|nr:hypothetical protein [Verrucomicrobiota bacterium]
MPVLYQRTDGSGFYAKASVQGSIVTFQLTERGVARLREAGVEPGGKFPLRLLLALYRPGDAYTLRGGTGPKAGYHEAEQFMFGFDENQAAETLFPACAVSGSRDDLHLVVSEDGSPAVARWLGPDARAALEGRTLLSLPLPLVTLDALARLEALGKLPAGSETVRTWRQWLADDLGAAWAEFRRANAQKQAGLGLNLPGELGLG